MNRLRGVVLLGLAAVVLGVLAFAHPQNASAMDTGFIAGTVTSNGVDGIEGITVDVFYQESYGWSWPTSVDTLSDGSYQVSSLEPGTYRLRFRDTLGTYANEFHSNKTNLDRANDITVVAAGTSPVDAQLELAGHITGKVTSNGVDGIEGVAVTAYRYENMVGGWAWMAQPAVYTDANGDYDIGALSTATYRIGFQPPGGEYLPEFHADKAAVESGDDVSVTAGVETPGIDATLTKASSISGTVTDGVDGIENVRVLVYKAREDGGETQWDYVRSAYTDASGVYTADGLVGGTYRLEYEDQDGDYLTEWYDDSVDLDSADDVEVAAATAVSDIDVVMSQAGKIAGTVSDGAQGISGIIVWVYQLDDSGVEPEWEYVESSNTESDGTYEVAGLRPGSYRVQFDDMWDGDFLGEYYNDKPTIDLANDVDVASGATTPDIDAVLSPAGKISGTVTNGASALEDIEVTAYWMDGPTLRAYTVTTGSNGSYEIAGLAPGGPYKLEFLDTYGTYITEYYNNKSDMQSADPVTVTAGATTPGINAALAKPVTKGTIVGKVTAAYGGAGLAGVRMTLSGGAGTAWTGTTGSYSLNGVSPGTYTATFTKSGYTTKTMSVSVAAGRTVSANAALARKVGTASVARTPAKSKVTYRRRSGVAKFKLAATMKGWGGSALSKRTVYLQTSKDGKKWKSTYKLTTGSTGKVSKSFRIKSKQVRYYRWYVPAKSQVNLKTYSAKTKVTVR